MIDYLFGKYDELNLFRKFDFDTDINALKQRVFAFVNVIPTYSHQSHSLKSIKHINENSKNALAKKLEGNFSAGIPAYIPMRSNDKFIFYTIERIDSLRDIVKYNNHFGRIIKEKV